MTVIEWLLDSDPAIRWQVKRDLLGAPADEVEAERALVATSGWGKTLLDLQDPEGTWDGGSYRPGWVPKGRPFFDAWSAGHFTLILLRDLGVDPSGPRVRDAIRLVRENVYSAPGVRYFEGGAEPCVSGMELANGIYFGVDVGHIGEQLLREALHDGGWNCFPREDAPVSSFHSTICALEGLLAWQAAGGPADRIAAVRRAGEEYLLERRLFRRKRDGRVADPRFTMTSYPTYWFYDILRGLDYFRSVSLLTGGAPDPRCAEAVEIIAGKRDDEGRWPHENTHEGSRLIRVEVGELRQSRWSTLRALRVLDWWTGSGER